ncbi:hypothetical protein ACWEKT_39010 [Nocardia takedensis]
MDTPASTNLALWNTLRRLPFGNWFFTQALCFKAPISVACNRVLRKRVLHAETRQGMAKDSPSPSVREPAR